MAGNNNVHGSVGRILKVCLSDSSISTIATGPYAERYVGSRGVASRIYWETVSPETRAFDPENR